MYLYAEPMDPGNRVVKTWGMGWVGAGRRVAKGGRMGDTCDTINNKDICIYII